MTPKELSDKIEEFDDESPQEFSEKIEDFFIVILGKTIYYKLWRTFDFVRNIPKEIKWFFQRGFRGYDDRCYWEIGDYLGRDIIRHLKHFRKMSRFGVPGNMCVDKRGKDISVEAGEKQWNAVLDKMIFGFEELVKDSTDKEPWKLYFDKKKISRKEWIKREKADYKKAQENAMLFITHFGGLWD